MYNMPKLMLIRLCFWLCLARTVVSGDDLYHKVGGEVLLKPDKSTVPGPITSILWKHGKNKVAEWDKDFGGLEIYAAFKERTTLNQATGELRIRGLTKTDSGVYSVEFNGKLLDKTYKLSVIKEVPKPTITSSCNTNKTSCTLTCEGDTTDAEPVTYNWKVGEGAWEVLDKHHTVSKSDTGNSNSGSKYLCKMKNSAGEGEVSEPVGQVFGPEAVPKPTITSSCNANKSSCTLTCEGDTTGAEPVTYSWKVGEGAWEVIGKHLTVSKSDTGNSNSGSKYLCKMKNSAGEGEVSEPVGQVFGPEAVPKPTITSSCNANKTSCTLTCEGNTTDAEPVTYNWKVGEGAWEVIGKHHTVSKSDTGNSNSGSKYLCKMKNSAGEGEVSEPVGQVFGPEAVPKPTITSSCNANKTSCTLTCEGDTTDAEPITYSWKVGEGAWEVLDKQMNVFKSDTGKSTNSYKYICKLNNSVSGEASEPVGEVFDPKAVPKPTITSSCNSNKTSCTLTCEGDATGAEPITYSWKVGEGAWEVIGKHMVVSKSDTGKSTNSYKYFCKLKNSAGEGEASEPVGQVFGPEPSEVGVGGVVAGVVVTILVLVATIIVWLVWKKKNGYPQDPWIDFLRKFCGEMCGSDGVQPEQGVTLTANPKTGEYDNDKAVKGQENGDEPSGSNSPKDESKPEEHHLNLLRAADDS
ncbi:carcinoembryonic antigen-related cell adhesion molecule 5-like isoform X2 [Coregonus clupeaformis]|uniref:carcinoembryonic antigen-related cell adhesion molecule 5-like isoform X2 n=1 Tax=Coregonus clupeaformis TaxID=59861 RepID=UPI001E1C8A75|nr:carcinoembryonic antigen-related cell adhesion molecule 5-like isoform X2 [Coregonus clupeaformis]